MGHSPSLFSVLTRFTRFTQYSQGMPRRGDSVGNTNLILRRGELVSIRYTLFSCNSIRWCVRPSVGPSVRRSVGPSVRNAGKD